MSKFFNLIYLFNKERDQVLLQKRIKNPFLGLYNGNGGKIEDGETPLQSAYRELVEETGYTAAQHNPIEFARVRVDGDNVIYVFYTHLKSDALPAAAGESLDLRWLSLEKVFNLSRDIFAPSVQEDIAFCLQRADNTVLI